MRQISLAAWSRRRRIDRLWRIPPAPAHYFRMNPVSIWPSEPEVRTAKWLAAPGQDCSIALSLRVGLIHWCRPPENVLDSSKSVSKDNSSMTMKTICYRTHV